MEPISDLSALLLEVTEQLNRVQSRLHYQEGRIAELLWKNHQLEIENRQLREELSRYKKPKKSSRNSSIPPSQESLDDKHIRRTQSLRVSSGLKPGGQVGHIGHSLVLPDHVDREEIHSVSLCPQCGEDLSGIKEELIEESYQLEIPRCPVEVIRHKRMSRLCSCGCLAEGIFPSHVRGHLSYGPGIETTVAYLNTVQHMPVKRLAEVMKDLFEVPLSQGTVHRMIQRMQSLCRDAYDSLREKVSKSQVVGADETGLNINGKLHWFWSFQTDKLTYIFPHKSRGKQAIDDHFPEGLPGSWLVTDRHSSYFNLFVKGHQICLPHVIRNLKYLSELDRKQTWSERLKKLLQEAIHKRKRLPPHRMNAVRMMNRFNELLSENVSLFHQDIQTLQTSLIKHREHVLNFLFHDFLPSDNNASERSIRPLKVKQKVSGGFRTDGGAMAYAVIHSITDTARKNGRSPWTELWEFASR